MLKDVKILKECQKRIPFFMAILGRSKYNEFRDEFRDELWQHAIAIALASLAGDFGWFRDPFVDKFRGLLREVAFHLTGFREETKEA